MFASRRSEKNARGRFWDWINPGLGKEVRAWLAGPVIGVQTHFLGKTQPCRRFITGGRMRCYCTANKLVAEWKGYVPLWDENGVQCFAIVGKRNEDQVFSIPLFAPVTVARLKRPGSPVCVLQSAWTDQPPPTFGEPLKSKDLRPWLLKLWGDESLIEFLNAHPEVNDEARGQDLKAGEFSPMLRAAARKANEGDRLPEEFSDVVKKLPSLNGKGRN